MEIKPLLNIARKNFDRLILVSILFLLIGLTLKYVRLLKESSVAFTEKELYGLAGLSFRGKEGPGNPAAFREMIGKKTNLILGIRPSVYYKRLKERNPFVSLRELVVMPFSLKPAVLKLGLGEKFTFETQNGIGPYAWECEPKNLGTFEGGVFTAGTPGPGKITVSDARGHKASTEKVEVAAAPGPVAKPVEKELRFIYHGPMKIVSPAGAEVLAIIEEAATGKTHSKKVGEEVGGFEIKDIQTEKLKLFDKKKGKEIELNRE